MVYSHTLVDNEATKPLASHIQRTNGVPASDAVMRSMGLARGVMSK